MLTNVNSHALLVGVYSSLFGKLEHALILWPISSTPLYITLDSQRCCFPCIPVEESMEEHCSNRKAETVQILPIVKW